MFEKLFKTDNTIKSQEILFLYLRNVKQIHNKKVKINFEQLESFQNEDNLISRDSFFQRVQIIRKSLIEECNIIENKILENQKIFEKLKNQFYYFFFLILKICFKIISFFILHDISF